MKNNDRLLFYLQTEGSGCSYKPDYDDNTYPQRNNSVSSKQRAKSAVSEREKSRWNSNEIDNKSEKLIVDYLLEIGKQRIQLPGNGRYTDRDICYNSRYDRYNGNTLYVKDLHHTYNVEGLKQMKQLQYMNLLDKQKNIGKLT
jgi:hypothetical protein